MKKLLFLLGIFAFSVNSYAQTDDDCSKKVLLAFFPEVFVEDTLSRYEVPEEEWDEITVELSRKDREVIRIVEENAAKMTPNPLKDPSKRQEAVILFRKTLYDVFADVMKKHGVDNREQIQSMLDDIQRQKARRFAICMEKNALPMVDDDYDDDDFDDDEEDY